MMHRADCFRVLAAHRRGEIAVCALSTALEWLGISPSDLNYTFVGTVGQAASDGLGLALAFPNRRILILDSDSSLLMNLGCLVTVSEVAPTNLVHLLFNSRCEPTGEGGSIPGRRLSFAGVARAAGYRVAREYNEVAKFQMELPDLLSAEGPVFADLRVSANTQRFPEQAGALLSQERQRKFKWAALSPQIDEVAVIHEKRKGV